MNAVRTVLAALACLAAYSCGRMPADDSAEAGFARDMAAHHEQAVEMSFIIRDRSEDEHLRTLAYDIIVTQSAQRGMLMAWLEQWGLPQSTAGARMAWMAKEPTSTASHDMAGAHTMRDMPLMAGMASGAELDALRRASGRDAEILFLQLMIRHHESGVLMTRALLAKSTRQEIVGLVQGMDRGQSAEIKLMTDMLADRGMKPLPSMLP